MNRRQTVRWGRTWTWGYRRGEWWIGARHNLPADCIEWNLFGFTLMVGRQ